MADDGNTHKPFDDYVHSSTDENITNISQGLNSKVSTPSQHTDGGVLQFNASLNNYVDAPVGTPTGMVSQFAGSTSPNGWLLCDGSAVSRGVYKALFNLIGTTYGAGDGSTTFNVPDIRGRVPVGAGTGSGLTARTLAATGGAETTSVSLAHSHTLSDAGQAQITLAATGAPNVQIRRLGGVTGWTSNISGDATTVAGASAAQTTGIGLQGATDSTTPSSSPSIMQPFLVLNYIIKT